MSETKESMERFDKVMRALVAVPKDEALKTMKQTISQHKKRTARKQKTSRAR